MKRIVADIKDRSDNQLKVLENILCYVGEQCVIEARDNRGYKDQTGNLCSSIGYAVIRNGVVVKQDQAEKVKNGDEGIIEGKKFLEERISKAKKSGMVLVVTAGMNYAEYVEAKGRNVLTFSEIEANNLVDRLMKRLGFKKR